MKLRHALYLVIAITSGILFLWFGFAPRTAYGFYSCGGSPCNGSYTCNAGLTCSGGVCGTNVNTCGGAGNATCQQDAVWSQGAPYNCGDQCGPGNTTRSYSFGACNVGCGNGTKVCNCGGENNCNADCGGATCGSSTACCVPQDPNVAPANVTVSQGVDGGAVPIRTAVIRWTYTNTTGCGNSWGFKCTGQANIFNIYFDGAMTPSETEAAAGGTITHTSGLLAWGPHTVKVCASNGRPNEACSAVIPFTLTPPPCITTPGASSPVCRNTDPTLSATYGNNANQIQYYVDNYITPNPNNILSSPYYLSSGWGTAASYAPAYATGAYLWTVMSQSTTNPIACTTPNPFPTGMQLNIDHTAPAVPAMQPTIPPGPGAQPTPVIIPNPVCPNEYQVAYNWSTVTDTGCEGLDTRPYHPQVASDPGFGLSYITDDPSWTNSTTLTTANYYTSVGADKTLYSHVQSRDALDGGAANESAYSATYSYTIPTPTKYPDIVITGAFVEDVGYNGPDCPDESTGMQVSSLDLSSMLNIAGTGTSYICSTTPDRKGYSCTINLDNQSTKCTLPTQNIILNSVSYNGYESVGWRNGNTCLGGSMASIPINASGPVPPIPAKLYFKYGQKTWFKTSGISYNNRAARNDIIPNNPVAFDSDDTVSPPNNQYFIVNGGGAVLQNTGAMINLGANAMSGGNPTYSANNWYSTDAKPYVPSSNFTPAKFADYMKTRKAYKTITAISDITADGVYYFSGNGTLTIGSNTGLVGRKVLIVADQATVDFTGNLTGLTTGTLGVIANKITIQPTVTEVDAILIGNAVDVGQSLQPPSATSLKIVGNLIQLADTNPAFANTRWSNDSRKPSLFIKLDQAGYMNLLEYLSISVYDWKQVQ